jgi:hypothetical protein
MAYNPRLQLDMTPDGQFRGPPRVPITTRIIAGAVLLAVVSGALAFAALALWVAMALIPIAIAAVLILVLTIRFKMWQARRRAGSVRSEGYVVRRP